jgi:hypothetical protein
MAERGDDEIYSGKCVRPFSERSSIQDTRGFRREIRASFS